MYISLVTRYFISNHSGQPRDSSKSFLPAHRQVNLQMAKNARTSQWSNVNRKCDTPPIALSVYRNGYIDTVLLQYARTSCVDMTYSNLFACVVRNSQPAMFLFPLRYLSPLSDRALIFLLVCLLPNPGSRLRSRPVVLSIYSALAACTRMPPIKWKP